MTIRQRIAAFFDRPVRWVLKQPPLPKFDDLQLVELRGGPWDGDDVAVMGLASTHTQMGRFGIYDYKLVRLRTAERRAVFELCEVRTLDECGQYEEGAKW